MPRWIDGIFEKKTEKGVSASFGSWGKQQVPYSLVSTRLFDYVFLCFPSVCG
jgi:hypothetical protein